IPATVFSPYCHPMALSLWRTSMIRSLPWSVIRMFPPGRNVFWTGVLSWLNPNPVTPKVPYCQIMLPLWSTRRTLLSTQPLLQFVVATGGIPVPDIAHGVPCKLVVISRSTFFRQIPRQVVAPKVFDKSLSRLETSQSTPPFFQLYFLQRLKMGEV